MQTTKNLDGTYDFPLEVGAALRGTLRLRLAAQGVAFTETKTWLESVFVLHGLTSREVRAWIIWVENVNLSDGPATGERHADGTYSAALSVKGRHRKTLRRELTEAGHTWWLKGATGRTETYTVWNLTRKQFYALRAEVLRLNGVKD